MNNCAASSMSNLSTPEREVVGGGRRGEGGGGEATRS